MVAKLDQAVDLMLQRLRATADEPSQEFPHFADQDTGTWTRTPDGDWTGSFFVGQLWLAAAATGDPGLRQLARTWAQRVLPRAESETIFRGFLFWYGAGVGAVLLGDDEARDVAVVGARALSNSYWPEAGLMPLGPAAEEAHSTGSGETNIDGVPGGGVLLLWAADELNDAEMSARARSHVNRHVDLLVRDDGSVVQSASLDPVTGQLRKTYTHKGISDDSTWARAQAWAMLGLAQTAPHDPTVGDVTRRVCDWWCHHLPAGGVSFWDFDAPATEAEPNLDTSATAIAASALLKVSALGLEGTADYREAAKKMVSALVEHHLTPVRPGDVRPPGMLIDSCYNRRLGLAIRSELIWGDYFLLESLMSLTGRLETGSI